MESVFGGIGSHTSSPSTREMLQKTINPDSPVARTTPPTETSSDSPSQSAAALVPGSPVPVPPPMEQTPSIDNLVGIDPSILLEDETIRNTQYNATLYDPEKEKEGGSESESVSLIDSTNNIVPDHLQDDAFLNKYRLMESASSLTLNDSDTSIEGTVTGTGRGTVTQGQGLQKPQPTRAVNNSSALLMMQQHNNSSTITTTTNTPGRNSPISALLRSNLKTPSSSARSSPRPSSPRVIIPMKDNNIDFYERSIAFDTLNNPVANNLQLILRTKHKLYKYTRISRTFVCGYDDHQYSETALKWAIDELMNDGDTLVCLKIIPKENFDSTNKAKYKAQNNELLSKILEFNTANKKISIILEISISSKVSKKLMQAISDYDPVLLIVGTSGIVKKGFKNIISPKSMSKYCLQYSEVPVVVVRPTYSPHVLQKRNTAVAAAATTGSLDQLMMTTGGNNTNTAEDYYKNLVSSFIPGSGDNHMDHHEPRSRSTSRRRPPLDRANSGNGSGIGTTTGTGSALSPQASNSSPVLRPIRSRGFSPVRSLSPFWKKKNDVLKFNQQN